MNNVSFMNNENIRYKEYLNIYIPYVEVVLYNLIQRRTTWEITNSSWTWYLYRMVTDILDLELDFFSQKKTILSIPSISLNAKHFFSNVLLI